MSASDEWTPPAYQFKSVQQRTWPEERAHVKYELILRQQPKQSRMCGVGEKADRRPIDPPPIVQLIVRNPPSTSQDPRSQHTSYLQNPFYFMHASLIEKDSRAEVNLIKDDQDMNKDKESGTVERERERERDRDRDRDRERERETSDSLLLKDSRTKATTGSCVSSLYPLKDFEDSGNESGFFVFPDLSVRMEGSYRLKFCLYEMTGTQVHFCASIVSAPLVVYSAKKFPGMEESTTLSQFFAEQGLKIRIRKEVRPKKRARAGYTRDVTFETPKQAKDYDPSESTEDDESRAVDRTSKRIAVPNDAPWRGAEITIRQAHLEHTMELPQRSEPASTEDRSRTHLQTAAGSHLSNRSSDLIRNDPRNPRSEPTRRSSDLSNRRNSDLNRQNPNADVQDTTALTEIPEHEVEYMRSHPFDRYPGEGPPGRGPEQPLDYLDPYDRLGPDYDPDYPPPSPNSRRYGRPLHDRPGGDRYDRAPGSYPPDKRWPSHYMYPGYYYFYYPPPRGYPDPYLRRFNPRYRPYPPPRGPIPYPYLPPEFLAQGMVPYPYPPNFRSFHDQDAPYPSPPYPSSGRRAPGGPDFYPGFPYSESYPPPDQDLDLQHYYPHDPYGPPHQPPSGNSSSSSSSSQPTRRAYPLPPYLHGYPSYLPYNLPQGDHPEDEELSESIRPSSSASDQQDYHRLAMSQYHYPDPYHAMDSFEPLVEPESAVRRSPRSPSTPGRGGVQNDRRDIVRTPSFNFPLQSPTVQRQGPGSGSGSGPEPGLGPGPGPELGQFRKERVHITSEEGSLEPRESRSFKSVSDKGRTRERRESDSVLATTTTDQNRSQVSSETVRSPSSHMSHERLGAELENYGLPLHPRRDIRERYGSQNDGRGQHTAFTNNSAQECGSERGPEQGSMAMAPTMARMVDEQEVQSLPIPMPTGNHHSAPPPYRAPYNSHAHPFGSPNGAPYAPHPHRSRNPGSVDPQNRVITPSMSYSYPPTPVPASGVTPAVREHPPNLPPVSSS